MNSIDKIPLTNVEIKQIRMFYREHTYATFSAVANKFQRPVHIISAVINAQNPTAHTLMRQLSAAYRRNYCAAPIANTLKMLSPRNKEPSDANNSGTTSQYNETEDYYADIGYPNFGGYL